MEKAAKHIYEMGAHSVVVKGGHLAAPFVTDIFYDGISMLKFTYPKINTKNTHGTGCTYSSAIASYLSKGYKIDKAVFHARKFMQKTILYSFSIGHGYGVLNPMYKIHFGLR
ncbi:MAG: bifunctional hydroxymethylpyrimidine kinase/phosphomethylpyrimidine kinase [Thermoplasmata archaeon]